MLIRSMIKLARPGHWIKTVFVLLPVVFGMRISDSASWFKAGVAMVAFCFASSFAVV